MNTHDKIELPPLPVAGEAMSRWAYDESEMQEYARAAVEADRQDHLRDATKMVPSDESLEKAWDRFEAEMARCPTDDELEEFMAQFADEHGNIADDQHGEAARALLARYGDSQPAAIGKPVGYVLIEDGKAVAFFDEIPPGHYRASAFIPVGIIGQPAASVEPRPDEYDYFVDWYEEEAPDENEVRNFDMARHAWLAGVRFADLFPAAAPVAQESQQVDDAAVSAIQFALQADEGLAWLRCWNEGDFDACRKWWPDAPEECFIGADPLHPGTKAALSAARAAKGE